MSIVKYIIEILKDEGKLIVSGLGRFTIEYKATTIHPIEHTFTPPEKIIVFESLALDDDLLALKISEKENISVDEASNIIKIFSDRLILDIQKGKLAGIEGFGVFSLTTDNLINFVSETTFFSDEEFGLSGFTSPAIVRSEFKDKAAMNIQKTKDEKIRRSKRNRKYVAIIASVVVVTALIFVVFFTDIFRNYLYNNDVTSDLKTDKALIANETHTPVRFVTKDSVNVIDTTDVKNTPSSEVKETDNVPVNKNSQEANQYYLVAGSFKLEENANKSILKLKDKGYNNAGIIRQSKNGMYIVYYGAYITKEDASKALQQIIKVENRDSWILKK